VHACVCVCMFLCEPVCFMVLIAVGRSVRLASVAPKVEFRYPFERASLLGGVEGGEHEERWGNLF